MFGVGPVASENPGVAAVSQTDPQAMAGISVVEQQIEKTQPAYFDTFRSAITSGSAPRVNTALNDAARTINSAAQASGAVAKETPYAGDCALYFVAVFFAHVYFVADVYTKYLDSTTTTSGMTQDKQVAAITHELAVA